MWKISTAPILNSYNLNLKRIKLILSFISEFRWCEIEWSTNGECESKINHIKWIRLLGFVFTQRVAMLRRTGAADAADAGVDAGVVSSLLPLTAVHLRSMETFAPFDHCIRSIWVEYDYESFLMLFIWFTFCSIWLMMIMLFCSWRTMDMAEWDSVSNFAMPSTLNDIQQCGHNAFEGFTLFDKTVGWFAMDIPMVWGGLSDNVWALRCVYQGGLIGQGSR